MATRVTLRQKPIKKGRQKSLYLDFYPPIQHPITGKTTRREFLDIHIESNPKTHIEKGYNNELLKRAELIRQKRENEINKPEIYAGHELEQLKLREKREKNFIEYFKQLADKRKSSNHDNWISAYHYLVLFAGERVRFADLDMEFVDGFKEYLLTTKSRKNSTTTLAQNSAVSYFNKFRAALKEAYKNDYLQYDLNAKIYPIKEAETFRRFLTRGELNVLAKTDCTDNLLKRAALFSALTGLRFSDIQKLSWGEIGHMESSDGEYFFLYFRQKKTKRVEMSPISKQAYELLGERRGNDEKVFMELKYSAYQNKKLHQWVKDAGIAKDITFHSFRHTYATQQINEGTNVVTLSQMLGHTDVKTTMRYIKIMDKTKQNTTDKIKLDF